MSKIISKISNEVSRAQLNALVDELRGAAPPSDTPALVIDIEPYAGSCAYPLCVCVTGAPAAVEPVVARLKSELADLRAQRKVAASRRRAAVHTPGPAEVEEAELSSRLEADRAAAAAAEKEAGRARILLLEEAKRKAKERHAADRAAKAAQRDALIADAVRRYSISHKPEAVQPIQKWTGLVPVEHVKKGCVIGAHGRGIKTIPKYLQGEWDIDAGTRAIVTHGIRVFAVSRDVAVDTCVALGALVVRVGALPAVRECNSVTLCEPV